MKKLIKLTFLVISIITIFILTLSPAILWSRDYKGGELYSFEAVQYGKWEMSMKAAKGSGILSTFFFI